MSPKSRSPPSARPPPWASTPVAALALTDTPTAAVAAPSDPADLTYVVTPVAVSPNTSIITKVTGPGGLNNTPARFGIGGTDLGIMWDNGIQDNPTTDDNRTSIRC